MIVKQVCAFALGGLLAFAATGVRADDSALLDVLVKKGILTKQEAEKLEAEVSKEPAPTQGGLENRIKIGDWVQEIDLYGDMRFREYYQTYQQQLPPAGTAFDQNKQNQRLRFRLRLDADFKLADNIFGGVQLETSDNRSGETTNATYTGGFDNYDIYISRAFMGWAPLDGLTFVIGKQNNPFYATELNWAPDVGPTGLVERIDFHALFGWGSMGEPAGYSKDGKTPPPAPPGQSVNPVDLSLIAGQFIFYNNNADSSVSFDKTDAFMFETQLLSRFRLFGGAVTIVEAPDVQIWNEAGLGPTAVLANGQPNPATSVTATAPANTGALGTLNNSNPFPIYTRDEFYLQSPGDINFKIANIPISLYWDLSYNVWGPERFSQVYGPLFDTVTYAKGSTTPIFSGLVHPSFKDYFAWLAGFRIGANRKAGDLSLIVDYRQVGLASDDPNIKSNDFNLSFMNSAGWRASISYNLTDFAVFAVTGWFANNLSSHLYGGFATSPSTFPIANANSSEVIAVDLAFRF
jgi:hypothetical protein